jgi:hypothetical protein
MRATGVVARLRRSVFTETPPSYIDEIPTTATREDWQALVGELIAEGARCQGEA